jgi:hypothetical protein
MGCECEHAFAHEHSRTFHATVLVATYATMLDILSDIIAKRKLMYLCELGR